MDDEERFCANPRCVLHVAPADPNVEGRGDWAEFPNGLMFARMRVADRFLCHVCVQKILTIRSRAICFLDCPDNSVTRAQPLRYYWASRGNSWLINPAAVFSRCALFGIV